MNNPGLDIESMLTIDETGMPKAPSIRQLQDKDVALLYQRDTSKNKRRYIQEVGVIYYLGDPRGPARFNGWSDKEALKAAIENYNLPKDYEPDALVKKIIPKYYKNKITEAGIAVEALTKSIHLVSISAIRINDILSKKLAGALSDEDLTTVLALMDSVNKRINEIPSLTKALSTAKQNLLEEKTESNARGGKQILSSMDANEDNF